MDLTEQMIAQLQKDLSGAKTYQDLMGKDGAIKKLLKNSLEQMLEAEMTEHLGYEKHSFEGANSGNNRNGISNKFLKTDQGEIDISIPRDRKGKFEPIVVGKYQKTIGDLESKVISMYAKGMTTRDIESHIEDIYGLELSATSISNITNTIIPMVKEWQSRPLDAVYPIVFLDAVHFKVKEDSRIVTKAAYTCLGIDLQGQKDMFGIWIGQAESSKFWMSVLTELRNRGVKDILITCVDGLKGFTEAIESVFPNTAVQKCVIHQIRNSFKYIASKDQKTFMKDLKPVYTSPTEEAALLELDNLDQKWGSKYPIVINSWRDNWPYLSTYFQYPQEIRTMIYTTNAVEALHRQFRKVTKSKTLFTNDDALSKMLYLAYKDISKKWTMPVRNWAFVISHLSVIFKERIKDYI
jgi:putative transposase